MPYSAVTQPRPVLRRNGGTRSSTVAIHSTCVSPKRARHEPSAYFATPGSRMTARIASGVRPEGRIGLFLLEEIALPDRRHRTAHRPARTAGNRADLAVIEFELERGVGPDLDRISDDLLGGIAHDDIAARQQALVTLGMGRQTAGEIVDRVVFRGERACQRGGEARLDIADPVAGATDIGGKRCGAEARRGQLKPLAGGGAAGGARKA